jgi:hypothetical protein
MNDKNGILYNIDTFHTTYPNNINIKFYWNDSNLHGYKIINYDKKYICNDDIENGLYRSVIVSYPENKIVAFSPPKSITNTNTNIIYVNETIEGIMINLFYDARIKNWEIATMSAISGNYYYSPKNSNANKNNTIHKKTFYQMFLDVIGSTENSILDELPKNYCYSFVLQHPDNPIVLKINKPRLYLVAVYKPLNANNKKEKETIRLLLPTEYENWPVFSSTLCMIDFPRQIDIRDCPNSWEQMNNTSIDDWAGVMFHLETGRRIKLDNPMYIQAKHIRNSNPILQYQYFSLRRVNQLCGFLYYFPKYKKIFQRFKRDIDEFITNIHTCYLHYYVYKIQMNISIRYLPFIHKIHKEIYVPSTKITRNTVKEYVERFEPRELLYHLRRTQFTLD